MNSGHAVAVLVGMGIAVQVSILGRAAATAHPLTTSLTLQLVGVVFGAVWATGRGAWTDVLAIGRTWWSVPLGVGGLVLVAALGFAAGRIGAAATLALSVSVQLVVALALDRATGAADVDLRGIVGVGAIVVGCLLVTGRV